MADWFVLGFAIAIIPLYIFGIIGNTMVIRIVPKTREMHTTTNYLLANLAVSDAISIFTILMYFAYEGNFGPSLKCFSKFSCKFVVIGDIATILSTSTLTVISVEIWLAKWCKIHKVYICLLYTSPSPRDLSTSRMPSSA